jgi:hypothetical protein
MGNPGRAVRQRMHANAGVGVTFLLQFPLAESRQAGPGQNRRPRFFATAFQWIARRDFGAPSVAKVRIP